MKYLAIILIASFATFFLQGQQPKKTIQPLPEREFTIKIPMRLIGSFEKIMNGQSDDISVGQYREAQKLFYDQAIAQQRGWNIEDSTAAARLNPPPKPVVPKKDSAGRKN